MNPKRKPKFLRQGQYLKRVGEKWRKPRGIHSKLRQKKKGKGNIPNVGYMAPKNLRGLHPSGFMEKFVENANQLSSIDSKKESVRISSKVGERKRKEIIKRSKELNLKILNA
ncbi:MAG: 50S ribosomal protein L32e [Candidatus Aenigmarchaeota archaeon]|nr:50S ribosomal protein L32e [Candidatus Aenigmarchaeota archaeon]